jgi:hypothetical protein
MCKKSLTERTRECPRCRADLSVLVDYVGHLQEGLERAEALTRVGQLGEAVWAYLEVLEIDPDNAQARRQVNHVVAAVRHFDRAAVGRRWLDRLQRQTRFRRWLSSWERVPRRGGWGVLVILLLLLASLFAGYGLGRRVAQFERARETSTESSEP